MMDGIFLAHEGPIYTIAHSPVTDLIYFTCGADWNIRIWMEGILQPLLTLQTKVIKPTINHLNQITKLLN